MGCDIHPVVEYRESESSPWQALVAPLQYAWGDLEYRSVVDFGRDYDLFSILGNVRNGYGFAGIKTGSGFVPMSDALGVPEDISDQARECLSDEHSATWVTLQTILDYDWTRTTIKTGCVNGVQFEKWDRTKDWHGEPDSYCGGISGPGIVHIPIDEMRVIVEEIKSRFQGNSSYAYNDRIKALQEELGSTYTYVEWTETYAEAAKQLWVEALPHMLLYGSKYGYSNVRLVMDFDS